MIRETERYNTIISSVKGLKIHILKDEDQTNRTIFGGDDEILNPARLIYVYFISIMYRHGSLVAAICCYLFNEYSSMQASTSTLTYVMYLLSKESRNGDQNRLRELSGNTSLFHF